jgi:hypothetical protein
MVRICIKKEMPYLTFIFTARQQCTIREMEREKEETEGLPG